MRLKATVHLRTVRCRKRTPAGTVPANPAIASLLRFNHLRGTLRLARHVRLVMAGIAQHKTAGIPKLKLSF